MKLQEKTATEIFRRHGGILRMSEAMEEGISRRTLYAMRDDGALEQLSRGLYRLASLPGMEAPDLVAVATRAPHGVVCLTSALAYHELTTQIPRAVDLAVKKGTEKPRIDYPPTQVYWFSGKAFSEGIEIDKIDGASVRIYSAEKSIADAFKFRNRIGLDVAIEALRTWRTRQGIDVNELLAQAQNCRVERVMRPYLEATM
jgi:predicted transcriptional regulator of viral defense system